MVEKKAYEYRDKPGVFDQIIGTIGLGLILILMVSLSFFLIARVSLSSKWTSQNWLIFWEVIGTVLVSRMVLIDDLKRAVGGYAFVLGMLIWIPFAGFALLAGDIQFGLGFTFLLIFVGWFTFKITWDVTDLDERDQDGDGLLSTAGLKKDLNPGNKKFSDSWGDKREESSEYNFEAEEVLSKIKEEAPMKPKGGKGRGVWVLYFLFGSIPIFGLAGATNDETDQNLKWYFFCCLAIYLFSCIALLMTTSFLTIRTDLRRRNLHMPLFTAGFWLFSGLLVLVSCFLFASILPRPHGVIDPVAILFSKKSGDSDISSSQGKNDGISSGEKSFDESNQNSKSNNPNDNRVDSKSKFDKARQKTDEGKGAQSSSNQQSPSFDIPGLDKFMEALAIFIKVFFGVCTLLFVIYMVVYKMSFTFDWAIDLMDWFRGIIEWINVKNKVENKAPEVSLVGEIIPFEEFSDPFDDKDWQGMSLKHLAGYTWKALLSWCKSQNVVVPKGCSPSDLEKIIANEFPAVEPAYFAFEKVLLLVQYSPNHEHSKGIQTIRRMWECMKGQSGDA